MPSNGMKRGRAAQRPHNHEAEEDMEDSEDGEEDEHDRQEEEWTPLPKSRASPVPIQTEPFALCPHFDLTLDLKRAIWVSCVQSGIDSFKDGFKVVEGLELRSERRELYCIECHEYLFSGETDAVRTHASYELVRRGFALKAYVPAGLGLRGLVNLGNTCFMNAVLQVLLSMESFRDYFLGGKHRVQCVTAAQAVKLEGDEGRATTARRYRGSWTRSWAPKIEELATARGPNFPTGATDVACCLGCEMEFLLGEAVCPARLEPAPFTAQKLLQHLWASSPALAGYYQQDAQELYNAFVNALHAHVCMVASLVNEGGEPSSPSGANQRDGALQCQCIAHKALGGVLQSQLTCTACGFVSARFEPFFEVPLDVVDGEDALENRLGALVKAESISGVFCSKCEAPREAFKRLALHVLPETLTVHLKRFHSAKGPSKNNAKVIIPAKNLDLKRFSSSRCIHGEDVSCECFVYDLRAVVQHAGQLAGGHYVCYARDAPSEFWFKYDDAVVTRVEESEALEAEAYMLFFQRR